jgi:acetoacetate decarboxylase
MKIEDVRRTAYSMPLTSPSFPPGPYRFFNREFFVITYRTDPEALAAVVPEPLEVGEPLVKYEFIRMPDSTGFGDYTETGQVIPVRFKGENGAYVHSMYLDDDAPIAGGRELWGFPKKLASPKIVTESDVLVGTLHYGSVLCASATMGYKYREVDHDTVTSRSRKPGPARRRSACSPMRSPTSRGCRCARSFRRCTSRPISPSAWAKWRSIIWRSRGVIQRWPTANLCAWRWIASLRSQ